MSANSCQDLFTAILDCMEKVPSKNDLKAPKLRPIARRRRNYVYLLLGILFGIISFFIVVNNPPNYNFVLANISVPILPILLTTATISVFSLFTFIFNKKLYGAVIAGILLSILIFRLLFLYL